MTNLHENKELFNDILLAAAQPKKEGGEGGLGINMVMLEKDYWLTRALQLLAESRFAKLAVFKGGTSLSKACGVGYRFSEDIDIAIISDDNRTDNQTKKLIGSIDKVMSNGLEEVEMPNTRKFSKYRKVFYRYPYITNAQESGSIQPGLIQLEIVSFANPYPYRKRKLGCLLREFLLLKGRGDLTEQYGLTEFEINVLDLERTAAEKIVSLIRHSLGNDYLSGLRSKIRHFYDLHYLLQNEVCKAYLESGEFVVDFNHLLAEDQARFKEPEDWQSRTVADSPLLRDFEAVWASLRPIYEQELVGLVFQPTIPDAADAAASFKTIAEMLQCECRK
ncbi:MAG: nucleotidyl transferase AbiEii/AbiGii toxin family protein [Bacteroidales bacterium]|nr:nucleotidyl transferase AbiEii/AbiGii toxin family protein [Bacteroidales bacterium]